MKYIQKPVEVDARQLTKENGENLAAWVNGVDGWRSRYWPTNENGQLKMSAELAIVTHNGERQTAFVGEWIVREDDSFDVYSEEVFNKRFDKAE